jgi:Cd2+/Zn2+-exporting ATPase
MEGTAELDLQLVLPGLPSDDACVDRLERALAAQRGVLRAHVDRENTPITLCLHYDPDVLSLAEVERLGKRAGASIGERYRHEILTVDGMDCSDCALVIEHGLRRVDGILAAQASYAAQTVRVEYDGRKSSRAAIEARLRGLGYALRPGRMKGWLAAQRELLFSAGAGVLLSSGWLGQRFLALPPAAAMTLYAGAYLLGGWDVARHAWGAVRARRADTDVLMLAAAIGAASIGDLPEGALLLFLFSLGHALEERVLDRARSAIRALSGLTPRTALVRRNGTEAELPVEQIQLEDVVVVRPGVRVPMDGLVVAGQSAVDQSPVTGESMPVEKESGAAVFAGTVNGQGVIDVRVTRLARDSTLSRVARMVEEAQTHKSRTQRLVERFERFFVPAVLIATVALIALLPLFGLSWRDSFLRAMTLLVAASPCALALGAPAALLAGVANAARHGVLVKGGAHLESLGRLRAVAFDKTGTLTHGRPEVTDVESLRTGAEEPDGAAAGGVLAVAAALEKRSGHPIAQAVVRAADAAALSIPPVGDVESASGLGVRGDVDGCPVLVGNMRLMEEGNVTVTREAIDRAEALQSEGKTTLFVARAGRLLGIVAVSDTLRPEVIGALAALRRAGVEKTLMLTGDNARAAAAMARRAGLDDVRAELMPEQKLEAVRELARTFGVVAMVGDGVNDAPALACATVGIAMGGASTDAALETADVVLMRDDLSMLPFAVGLGRATRAIVAQNLGLSLAVIGLLVASSLAGFAGIGAAIAIHEGSTLVVALNALRLLGYRPGGRHTSP